MKMAISREDVLEDESENGDELENSGQNTMLIPLSKYPNIRVASIIKPQTLEVPIYRVCNEEGKIEEHTN